MQLNAQQQEYANTSNQMQSAGLSEGAQCANEEGSLTNNY